MEQCLFCVASENLTDEHVIPGALGCDLVVPSSTCRSCNERFSREFEAAVNNSLRPVMYVLGIGDRDGIVRSQDVQFDLEGRRLRGHLTADGDLVVRPLVEKALLPDGKKATYYWFFDKKSREGAERRAKARGDRFEVGPLGDGGPVEIQPSSSIELDFVLSDGARRFAAKAAFMALAYKVGAYARAEAFAEIRRFIAEGGTANVRLFCNSEFAQATRLTPFHHFIIGWADHGSGEVWVAVVLFGGLNYLVQLSTQYSGADFGFTVAYEAHQRKTAAFFVGSLENEKAGTELIRGPASKFDDLLATAEPWARLVEGGGRYIAHIRSDRGVDRESSRSA